MRLVIPVWLRPTDLDTRRRLFLLLLTVLSSVQLGFATFTPAQDSLILRYAGYPLIALTFAAWIGSVWRLRPSVAEVRRWVVGEGRTVLAWTAALTLLAVLTAPYLYKVLYDEAVVQGTATTMHWHREVGSIGRAYAYDGGFQILQPYLDKRPYFFPFLVSVLHDLTGWRESNAFALNTLLLPVVLLLAYAGGRALAGHRAGLVSLVSLGAFSLLLLNATGAGLEMLNLALVLGLVVSGASYLDQPNDARLDRLVLTVILLANTRYESSIYVGSAALIVLVGWARAGRPILPWGALAGPLLLIPYALHNRYLAANPTLWELRDGLNERFSLDYLSANIGFARTFFFNLGPAIANSPWLTYAGAAALIGLAITVFRLHLRWADLPPAVQACIAVALGVGINLVLLLAYYWGDLSDPIVSRLSLPLHSLLALAIGGTVGLLERHLPWRLAGPAIIAALVCYGLWGARVTQNLPDLNLIETTQRWELAVIKRLPPAERLVLTDKSPLFWFAQGMGSTSCTRAAQCLAGLEYHWRARSFQEILVIQRFAPLGAEGGWMLESDSRIPAGITLESIAERRFGVKLQRVSRVVAITLPPAAPSVPPSVPDLTDHLLIAPCSTTSVPTAHVPSGN
jgi:hypothetical protein